jgi:DNA polymerase-3 subunit alpha
MGKKKREEMVVHEEKFVAGAVERGIREDKARKIFELMERFADYGFNRSHSVAYAYVAYQTAYLKAHHATHFYASVLSHEANDTAKVYKYSNELKASGLTLLPPDINESGEGFTPLHGGVRYGLTAIKGLGSSSVSAIIAARATGHFTSIFDFTQRIPANAINRRSLESLIFAGAFDSLKPEHESVGGWRARLHASIDLAVSVGQRAAADREKGQNNLFGSIDTESVSDEVSLINAEAWSEAVILSHEKDAVGFYLSSHPLDAHADALAMLGIATTSSLIEMPAGKRVRVAGIVTGAAFKYSRKGNRFSIFQLEDQTGSVKCLAWSEACTKYFSLLADDEQLLLDGKIESNDGTDVSFVLDSATRLADALPKMSTTLEIEVPEHAATEASFEKMLTSLAVKDGECAVVLKLALDNGIVVEVGGLPFSISGSSEIDRILSEKGCKAAWSNGGNGGK